MRARLRRLILPVALCLAMSATGAGQRNSGQSNAGWSAVGGTQSNQRYTSLTEINRSNVANLRGAWESEEFENGAQSRSAPVVQGDSMFVTAGQFVVALDARTGKTLWKFRAEERQLAQGTSVIGPVAQATVLRTSDYKLPSNFGVAVGDGMVFAGLTGGYVVAISADEGKLLWSTHIGDNPPRRGEAVSAPPLYHDGKVFAGLSNGDFGVRGRIVALDAKSGKELWRFNVVPGPGEFGYDTWQRDNDAWARGGGGIWIAPSLDPELGLIYFSTGNPVPMTGGEIRGGDNLFTASLVALDIKTGARRWHEQPLHHDIWDADLAVAPVLYETASGKKAVGVLRGDGYLFLHDRATGKPLFPLEERPVPQDERSKTARTQPFPVGGETLMPSCDWWKANAQLPPGIELNCSPFTPISFNSNVVAPGFGLRSSAMSYSPRTGFFYAAGGSGLGLRRRVASDPYFVNIGAGARPVPGVRGNYTVLGAYDSRTGKVAWRREGPNGAGGTLATASDLLFRMTNAGALEALDARTGDTVAEVYLGLAQSGPIVSYESEGHQYVAIASRRRIYSYSLNGTLPLPERPAPRQPAAVAAANDGFAGPIEDTSTIETASMLTDMGINGQRFTVDEHTFNPYRARVKKGTRVTWMNNGTVSHTLVIKQLNWTSARLMPAQTASVVFDTAGNYTYMCKDHPWAYGQVVVVE